MSFFRLADRLIDHHKMYDWHGSVGEHRWRVEPNEEDGGFDAVVQGSDGREISRYNTTSWVRAEELALQAWRKHIIMSQF